MKTAIGLIVLLLFATVLHAQSQKGKISPMFVEPEDNSVEIITAGWIADSVEYRGDPACKHNRIQGPTFWHKERELAGTDSTKLANLPARRVMANICSLCLRKEFLVENVMKKKVESEYSKLQKQMLLRKPK